ncbi:MAG: bifunctional 2-polyprenyl-6-hydroxyphenol methylase/3-demethylubiquinol 3-O-methyltransferase UbiG [Pseudomonadota bacterium]|nr:bifunctional 2-polyprenyl-6-hydroxyphenol methylase/3-demethylubiquinol 3-O-methyltransferase UbiG [Pseudomonadota bacterium]MDE3038152.1 bifunctional 2-polyprenyl-6-hydroxyphenol methylase/3-demethylubiquinol 3-O-methyltransferase UbiG [Pseudomonadota bacterium]
MKRPHNTTVDAVEVDKFSRLADQWWDEHGAFAPLHRMNPVRIQYILNQLPVDGSRLSVKKLTTDNCRLPILEGIRLLDIGCGGGLICEPMARLGAEVTGIDASAENIAAAKLHARQAGLEVDYICTTAEEMVDGGRWKVDGEKKPAHHSPSTSHFPLPFDIVLALEIIEHVADVEAFVAASAALVKPGGLIFYSTLNRTAKSFALAIVGAEYVLRWLPRGTHDWKKFLRPHELVNALRRNNIEITEMTGMVFNPLDGQWRVDAKDLGVNYMVAGEKV